MLKIGLVRSSATLVCETMLLLEVRITVSVFEATLTWEMSDPSSENPSP